MRSSPKVFYFVRAETCFDETSFIGYAFSVTSFLSMEVTFSTS